MLKDVEDGKYDGYAELAVSHLPLQNPAQRKFLGLTDNYFIWSQKTILILNRNDFIVSHYVKVI